MTEPTRLIDISGIEIAPQLTAGPDVAATWYVVSYGPYTRCYAFTDKAAVRAHYAALPDFVGWYDDGGGTFSIALSSTYGGAPVSTVEQIPGYINPPADGIYPIIVNSKYAFDIDELTLKLVGGTVTVQAKINSTAVTGLNSVAVTSSEATTPATAARSVAVGDDVFLILSAGVSPVGLSFNFKATR